MHTASLQDGSYQRTWAVNFNVLAKDEPTTRTIEEQVLYIQSTCKANLDHIFCQMHRGDPSWPDVTSVQLDGSCLFAFGVFSHAMDGLLRGA